MFNKDAFKNELLFFYKTILNDLNNGFSLEKVEDGLVKLTASFYGARLPFDKYATDKCYFIATNALKIINGENIDSEIEDFYIEMINKKVK